MEEWNTIDGYRNTPVRNNLDPPYRNSSHSVNTIHSVNTVQSMNTSLNTSMNTNSLPRHSRSFIGNNTGNHTGKTYDHSYGRSQSLYGDKPRRAWTEGKATDE